MPYNVKNLNGTSNNRVPCGYTSWLDFWEKKSGKKARECACCYKNAEVGAHVQKANSDDRSWYIVPLCCHCNCISSSEEFTVYDILIPVNS